MSTIRDKFQSGWTATVLLTCLFIACSPAGPAKFTTGPVALQGAEQMQTYLCSAEAWKLWYRDDPEQYWQFRSDGSFTTWIVGESEVDLRTLLAKSIPARSQRLTGTWQADDKQLLLRAIRTAEGEAVPPLTLPLKWVDGKLRIEIGGNHYMRSQGP